ncbi:rRNA methyltransferase 1, mitochondrial [Thalassophryne amazonica]|uniref:rRNA methyltransferase 1, mitochondrial n=1 Tax=Thalassophryne amazonica TaxID=390379 RepID=UPI001472565F|nr:rRNA methyltransferase 1, mitochondrial [Thalassophryne amazonica]
MWLFSITHQHGWCRRLMKPVSNAGFQLTSYHATSSVLCPLERSSKPVVRRRRSLLKSSTVQHVPVAADGKSDQPSPPPKAWKKEVSFMKKEASHGNNRGISFELKKLCLEDFTEEKARLGRETSTMLSSDKKYEIVFGIAPCLFALTQRRRKVYKLFVKDGEAAHRNSVLKVCEEAHRWGVPIQRVSKKDLDKLAAGRVHQGVCLQASPLKYLVEDKVSAGLRKDDAIPLWLVLEEIQDPMNLGAILRSAYFLGVDRVASSLRSSCPLTPVVSKASSGIMEVLGVYGYQNLEDMIKMKAAQGWQVIGTVGAETEEILVPVTHCLDFNMTKPTLLLIGGEGDGLSQQLLSLCQTLLTIPPGRNLLPGIESLNVSVAAAILLHSLLSSRRLPI